MGKAFFSRRLARRRGSLAERAGNFSRLDIPAGVVLLARFHRFDIDQGREIPPSVGKRGGEKRRKAAASGDPIEAPKRIRVACVGDSITAGYGLPSTAQSYPAQLGKLLGEGWEVGNFGSSGKTLLKNTLAPYWKTGALNKALAFKPDVVVIQLGTNDTKQEYLKLKGDFVGDYKALIALFQKLDTKPRIFLCRPPFIFRADSGGDTEEGLEQLLPLIDQVATETGLPEIDNHAVTGDKGALFPDKLHPNQEGAGILARTVYRGITGKSFEVVMP
ncbi:Lysophospholipase L1 [Verrucomicrobium sp. GAS474]|uniref:GDSL-type esterase/lipase family protein n=1 Tax=Verrucomicrobium sp. GAS474 TaxID=1882831 RepID=UPI000879CE3E|nr:GDSL-type esterase/lipase family protein [Verrucomicrobium sp. GAS474]SDU27352.1 Lysophospholipase L1 [Verrucomicrobium sp. GAS474]